MRFIDMFMAALGALIFLAMLFAFLIRDLPKTPKRGPDVPTSRAQLVLLLATRKAPPADTGAFYHFAFAYRGGTGPVSWSLTPPGALALQGLSFDNEQGIISGTPSNYGTIRFVVTIKDAQSRSSSRAFELEVRPAERRSNYEAWIAGIFLLLLVTLLGIQIRRYWHQSKLIKILKGEQKKGHTHANVTYGRGIDAKVELGPGIATYEEQLKTAGRRLRIVLLLLIASAGFVGWRFFL